MIDWFIIFAPVLLVPIILLFVFLSCGPQQGYPITGTHPYDSQPSQSETALCWSNPSQGQDMIVVAYNDDGGNDSTITYTPTTRHVVTGANLMGWSYSKNQGKDWTYGGKVPLPLGVAVLWGDPSLCSLKGGQGVLYMTNLMVPKDRMPVGGIDGYLDDYVRGACIARSLDGGITFQPLPLPVLSDQEHRYDGSSLASDWGSIYAAFLDIDGNEIDVWYTDATSNVFYQLPTNPFPGMTIISHPRIRVGWGGNLYVAAHSDNGQIYMNRWNKTRWGSPVRASNYTSPESPYPPVNFSSSLFLRTGPQFSFDVYEATKVPTPQDGVRMLYTAKDPNTGQLYVTGSYNSPELPDHFNDAPQWGTTPGFFSSQGDQFNPNVKVWENPNGKPVWKATYLDRRPSAGDTVTLFQGNLAYLPNGKRIYIPMETILDMPVCPDQRGYWGDYDDLTGFVDGSTNISYFIRTMSDSSAGCVKRWMFTEQNLHIIAAIFEG